MVPSPILYGLFFPKIGVRNPPTQNSIAIVSGTGKGTNFKFGKNNNRVHPNNSPLQILEKRECGRIQGLPKFFRYPVISGTGKATNFKFCTHVYRLNRNKRPLKILGKVAVGVVRDCQKFSRQPYIGHIAWSSLQ